MLFSKKARLDGMLDKKRADAYSKYFLEQFYLRAQRAHEDWLKAERRLLIAQEQFRNDEMVTGRE